MVRGISEPKLEKHSPAWFVRRAKSWALLWLGHLPARVVFTEWWPIETRLLNRGNSLQNLQHFHWEIRSSLLIWWNPSLVKGNYRIPSEQSWFRGMVRQRHPCCHSPVWNCRYSLHLEQIQANTQDSRLYGWPNRGGPTGSHDGWTDASRCRITYGSSLEPEWSSATSSWATD